MKLILTQEVNGLGTPGDVIEVRDGYGRNYLVPRGLAIRWTKGGEKQVATIRRARQVREVRDLGQAQEIRSRLESLRVRLTARAGTGGRLFGSITAADVADAVRRAGVQVDRRRVELVRPIKSTGTHQVTVRVHPEVTARLDVEVTGS